MREQFHSKKPAAVLTVTICLFFCCGLCPARGQSGNGQAPRVFKADSVSITDGGRGDVMYGGFSMSIGSGGGFGNPVMRGRKVYIFRNLPVSAEKAHALGIKAGAAYFWNGNGFQFLRNVDLSLDDKALCALFGVTTENSWHRTFWSPPASSAKK